MDNKKPDPQAVTERRKYLQIRDVFDEAYRIARPLMQTHGETSGVTSRSMLHQTLHNAFPDLHKQDLPILIASLTRVFFEQNKGDAP